jgi:hypothetical protein
MPLAALWRLNLKSIGFRFGRRVASKMRREEWDIKEEFMSIFGNVGRLAPLAAALLLASQGAFAQGAKSVQFGCDAPKGHMCHFMLSFGSGLAQKASP